MPAQEAELILWPVLCTFVQGLSPADLYSHIRVLQRKLARAKEEVQTHQAGRLDISIPNR